MSNDGFLQVTVEHSPAKRNAVLAKVPARLRGKQNALGMGKRTPPTSIDAHERQVARALAGIHSDLVVRRMIRNTGIFVGHRAIAELGTQGFRLLPNGGWQQLRLDDAQGAARIRALLIKAVRFAGRHGGAPRRDRPDVAHTPENWASTLNARGVPARVHGSRVYVPRIGPVNVPGPQATLKSAAGRFVRVQTHAARPELKTAIGTALGIRVARVQIVTTKRGVGLRVDGERVAVVNRFQIIAKKVIWSGDLLATPGALHCLLPAIDLALAKTATRRDPPASRAPLPPPRRPQPPTRLGSPARRPPPPPDKPDLRFDFPDTLTASARDRAMQASARLRSERTLVPAVSVEVPTPHGTLMFEPLDEAAKPLEARFAFHCANGRFSGGLRLKRPGDPITLRVDGGSTERLAAEAWAAALIVYAELTCVVIPGSPLAEPTTPTSRPSRPSPTATPPGRRPRAPGAHRPKAPGGPVIEVPTLRDAIDQMRAVSGHMRRLRAGARASDEAIRAAERAGIRVPTGYTWVRPHGRGAQTIIRVQWPRDARLW
jgi:hypothetical protein